MSRKLGVTLNRRTVQPLTWVHYTKSNQNSCGNSSNPPEYNIHLTPLPYFFLSADIFPRNLTCNSSIKGHSDNIRKQPVMAVYDV
jgi:hypothetical protein